MRCKVFRNRIILSLCLMFGAFNLVPDLEADELAHLDGAFHAISVQNLDEAVNWYSTFLGFEEISRAGNDQRKGALMAREGAVLELAEFEGALSRDDLRSGLQSHEVHGIFKLGFTTEHIDATFEALKAQGAEIFFEVVTTSDGRRTFGIKDLEGNIIQFIGQ